jgi:hypothetical protein
MESKPKKRYLVYFNKGNFTIESDYVIENHETNRMSFFIGKTDYEFLDDNPLVASFPLDKSSIIEIILIKYKR